MGEKISPINSLATDQNNTLSKQQNLSIDGGCNLEMVQEVEYAQSVQPRISSDNTQRLVETSSDEKNGSEKPTYVASDSNFHAENNQVIDSLQQANVQLLASKLLELQDQNILPLNYSGGSGDISSFNSHNHAFWSNHNGPTPNEEFYSSFPNAIGHVNRPMPFPNLSNINAPVFYNPLTMNASQQHRRSPPIGSMFPQQSFATPMRPSANSFPFRHSNPIGLNNAWNSSQHSTWNSLGKPDRSAAMFDSMRFQSMESQLLDIVKNDLPDVCLPGKSPFFTGFDDYDDRNRNDSLMPSLTGGLQRIGYAERYSRKVFVGGLPPDIAEDEITASFRRFGPLVVDWPHKAESKSYFPPKGYAFLLFQEEASVQALTDSCLKEDGKMFLCVSSPTIKEKPVQIRPWKLADSDYVMDGSQPLDPRKTIFVGGVPRPLKACELAHIMDRLYGGVCYTGIDTDPELKYPKGAGRVAFATQQSYIAAISARFVQLQHCEIDKRVEVKPYVLDDQECDECGGSQCNGKYAPFFCANVTCLLYYCEHCWAVVHSRQGREFHKPLVKEGVADRARPLPQFRW